MFPKILQMGIVMFYAFKHFTRLKQKETKVSKYGEKLKSIQAQIVLHKSNEKKKK